MYKLAYGTDRTAIGFYKDGIHDNIPEKHISITTELWQHLLNLGDFLILDVDETKVYTIDDKDKFEVIIPDRPTTLEEFPSLEERVTELEKIIEKLTKGE